MQRSVTVVALCLLAVGMPLAFAANCNIANQPRLVLTDATGCLNDPIAQCLSDFSLDITDSATCAMKPNVDTLPEAATTVRIQKRWDANTNIKRNAMLADFPFIGDDAYIVCAERIADMTASGGATGAAAIAAMFNKVDSNSTGTGATAWTAVAGTSSVTATRGSCALTYSVLYDSLDAIAPVTSGASESAVTVADGEFAALISQTGPKLFIAALCPSGTYSARVAAPRTIKTGCDKVAAGTATNKVGATSATDVSTCKAGTFAGEGAAMCLPCDKDQYAPFDGMNVCAECKDGYAPIQGSVRCFAGFGGRVLVTEGKSVGTANKIYDPNGSVFKIYGDDSSAVTGAEGAIIPAGFTYTTDENTDDGVPAMGGPLDGWAAIKFAATTSGAASLAFLDDCVAESQTGGVLVSEDAVASISMLSSNKCGQINGKVDDISGTVPVAFTTPDPNFTNLTLVYASPEELVAFGMSATGASDTVTIHVYVSGGSTKFTLAADATSAATALSAKYDRNVDVLANTFGEYTPAAAPSCPAGTSYVEKADSAGVTYSKQCRPCPDGYYCPAGRSGFSPVATPCDSGSRGIVFGQTVAAQCVQCKEGFFQDTAGSVVCDSCASAPQGAKTCPTSCPDGTEGDPKVAACTPCALGTYRSGDMPACIPCGAGSEVWADDGTGDKAINVLTTTGGQACKPCEPGSYNDYNTTGVCTVCDAGKYAPRGQMASCLCCPAGTYQDLTGANACKKAAKATFITGTCAVNNTASCKPGTFGEVAGMANEQTACKKCKPGTYSNATGSTSCEVCKTGFYQDKSAQTGCTQCPAGTINTATGSSTCAICAPGSFSARGASTCSKCPVGTFQDKAKQSGCKPCPAGSFCPQAGMTRATKCPIATYGPRPNGSSQRLACLPCAKNTGKTGQSKC